MWDATSLSIFPPKLCQNVLRLNIFRSSTDPILSYFLADSISNLLRTKLILNHHCSPNGFLGTFSGAVLVIIFTAAIACCGLIPICSENVRLSSEAYESRVRGNFQRLEDLLLIISTCQRKTSGNVSEDRKEWCSRRNTSRNNIFIAVAVVYRLAFIQMGMAGAHKNGKKNTQM